MDVRMRVSDPIKPKVKETITRHGLIKPGDRVLVCVSGGPDSIAMLHVLVSLKGAYRLKLTVAHFDHKIRGRASQKDAEFVRDEAKRLGLPFVVGRGDVKRFAASGGLSLEEAAREMRYAFFVKACRDSGSAKMATGHTINDQAETLIMRFIRGSGSAGLSGIPYKRRIAKYQVIRPVLDITRREIENYLRRNRLRWREDATNLHTRFVRNRLRHELLPLIKKEFNPRIEETLSATAATLCEEFDFTRQQARKLLERYGRQRKGRVAVEAKALSSCHKAVQRMTVRCMIEKCKGDLKRVTYKNWLDIEKMIAGRSDGPADIPGGISASISKGRLCVFKKAPRTRRPSHKKTYSLKVPGKLMLPQFGLTLSADPVKGRPTFRRGRKGKRAEHVDLAKTGKVLRVRSWRAGDRIRPLGMDKSKKIHDIFVDDKIPRETRSRILLVLSRKRVVWLAGVRLSDLFKVDKDTERIIRLSVSTAVKK